MTLDEIVSLANGREDNANSRVTFATQNSLSLSRLMNKMKLCPSSPSNNLFADKVSVYLTQRPAVSVNFSHKKFLSSSEFLSFFRSLSMMCASSYGDNLGQSYLKTFYYTL